MEEDSISTNTSADDKTEDFCDNPTKDSIAEGLLGLIKPAVDLLDEKFNRTREAQLELRLQIEALSSDLNKIALEQKSCVALDTYTKKLAESQQKVTVVSNILQATQARLIRLQQEISKETTQRKALLEPGSLPSQPCPQ